jgi:hypothetical protein
MRRQMIQARVYEGTWDELVQRADELRGYPKLMLIVPPREEALPSRYRADLTPEERIRILDVVAERNKNIPALPPHALSRESLYADDEEQQ